MKRKISLILTLILMLSTVLSVTVSAASYPSLSTSAYCEFTAAKQINVWKNTGCTTRGTCSPSSAYNAYIGKNDVCYIYKITSSYAQVNYPTSSGRKTGYIKTKDLLGSNTNPSSSFTASNKVTTLKYKNGATSGYYESGDKVYILPGTNYNVIYTAKSGKRAYKLAYADNNEPNILPKPTSTPNEYTKKLDKMISGASYNGAYKVGIKYSGAYYTEQCKGFARSVHEKLFGYVVSSTQSKPKNYLLHSNKNTVLVGTITSMNASNAKKLFTRARTGDFVQMRRDHSGSHSAIVYSVSSEGITFYEANLDGKNTIYKKTYTWNDLCDKNAAMSLYTAKNY